MSPIPCSKELEIARIDSRVERIEQSLDGVDELRVETQLLSVQVKQLVPQVAELNSWRGSGQTREIEALRAALLEQARAEAKREHFEKAEEALREVQIEERAHTRKRVELRYALVTAIAVAVVTGMFGLGRQCGMQTRPSPAGQH
jgi:hypothetical protein